MQRVIKRVHTCLCDLKLAIDGTIVMSPALKESLDAMYDARIPETWMKVTKKTHIQLICHVLELSAGFKRCLDSVCFGCSPIFMVSLLGACRSCVRAALTIPERGPK